MPPLRYCAICLSAIQRTVLHQPASSLFPAPFIHQTRNASQTHKRKDAAAAQKKKKQRNEYKLPDLKQAIQFSLVDAMRYLRAAEVGRPPTSSKYELHVRFKTPKNGAVVRNRLRLPHPVSTDNRIAVICAPDSPAAKAAIAAGAHLVGEDTIFDAVKAGTIDFERCICHADSLQKLAKSGVARILGPRGLMPSAKTATVVKDVGGTVRTMAGAAEYRERVGVVRMAIGQLGFTPEEVAKNIRTFIAMLKKDMAAVSDRTAKELHEIVLSSTNGPGLSLNGEFRGLASPPSSDLSTL